MAKNKEDEEREVSTLKGHHVSVANSRLHGVG
jgi:hypothetical protein